MDDLTVEELARLHQKLDGWIRQRAHDPERPRRPSRPVGNRLEAHLQPSVWAHMARTPWVIVMFGEAGRRQAVMGTEVMTVPSPSSPSVDSIRG